MDVEGYTEDAIAPATSIASGGIRYRKARRKRQKILVRKMLSDYANNTTLHGLSYTTKREITLTEKIFWIITFVVSICLCCYLINNVWIKWNTSPVIVTISEQLVSVTKVPFPSVTICPQSKINTDVYNYSAEQKKLYGTILNNEGNISMVFDHQQDFIRFEDISLLCKIELDPILGETLNFFFPRNYTNADIVNTIYEVSLRKELHFDYCAWRGVDDWFCNTTVTEILTGEGLCYNFNSLAANEILREENIHKDYPYLTANKPSRSWSMEYGYTDFGSNVYPAAGKDSVESPDLIIIMRTHLPSRDKVCNALNSGFKIYIQHPADLPQSSLYHYTVVNNQVLTMALTVNIVNTSDMLKSYHPRIRQCYFSGERYLKYFKIYTANNCRIECLSNMTYKNCGCVGFYMPHASSKRICTRQNLDCMTETREKIANMDANDEVDECQCYPACDSIEYEAEALKRDSNTKEYLQTDRSLFSSIVSSIYDYSELEVYFKRPRFVPLRRSELFGLTDFLANIGGLLGLFLGFSFLSFVELVYFLTLRLCCVLKEDLKQEKLERRNTSKKF